ncbi:hypothetical protein EJB05_42260 [Eragrostis curvula]|uniref:Uncharacterized protein n=1 Tax=Eragrostis curvula TaxID=38414 RepID=A0A5J9TBV8_9POAL|nr:hypothetical protein EJB05_42260 [Eragrostis curvula]
MPVPDKKRKRKIKVKDRVAAAWEARLIRVRRGNKKKKANSEGSAAKQPVFLVLEHGYEKPSYSVIEASAGAVAHRLVNVSPGMSFAAVGTRDGPRIVGVGVEHTTVYDPKTSTDVLGPRLVDPKMRPVLIPHGSKLYALARNPSVVQGLDFVPWFSVLDLDPGTLPGGARAYSTWCELPSPPLFPCRLNPLEYRNPPKLCVASYAVVGSYILLSVQQDKLSCDLDMEVDTDKGTCAFDMDSNQWEMVDDKNLPFIGQAVPLGGHHFIAPSRAKGGAAAVYYIDVFPPGNTNTGKTELSIVELPVASKGTVPGQMLCSMGKGSFTSFDIRFLDSGPEAKVDKSRIVHRTYSLVSADDAETNSIVIVKQQRQIFKLRGPFSRLAHPSPVVAALTMMPGFWSLWPRISGVAYDILLRKKNAFDLSIISEPRHNSELGPSPNADLVNEIDTCNC